MDRALEELREEAKRDLYVFSRAVLGFDYMVPEVHGPVCQFLMKPWKRKLIELPRGFLKTTLTSVAYPLWRAIQNPNIRIVIVMKTIQNAQKTLNQIRSIVERNETFRALFPEVIPESYREVRWSDTAVELKRPGSFREATFEAAGIGTTLTSRHYDIIIEDDLVAPDVDNITGLEAMPTREEIEKAIGWHRLARSLLISLEEGEIIHVGTRWSKYDLIQHIIDNEPHTARLKIPAIDEHGNPTYPSRFPLHVLEEIRAEQGTYIFATQYLLEPVDEANMTFKPQWLEHYWETEPEGIKKVITVDPAISKRESAAYSVVAVLGALDGRLYVLDYLRGHWNPGQLIDAMFSAAGKWGVKDVYVEAVAWQEALAYFFEIECKRRGEYLNVQTVRPGPDETKETRIRGLQPFAESGRLLLKPWMRDLKIELLDFPFSKTKDIADAVAYGPRVLRDYLTVKPKPKPPEKKGETMGDVLEQLRRRRTMRWGFPVPVRREIA